MIGSTRSVPRGRRLWAVGVVAIALAAAGCAGTAGTDAKTAPKPSGTAVTSSPASTPTPPPHGSTLYGVRYCEILTVTAQPGGGATAEVWNTMGLDDCPQALWHSIDLDDVKAQTGATQAVTNGPRYWMLDSIVPGTLAGSLQVRDFSGIRMRSIASVELPTLAEQTPYTETSVARDTTFTFAAGRKVYELTAPDGSIYIMQSYSRQIDPHQTADDLASLGDRLHLPADWTFTTRVLTEGLEVTTSDGIATVVTDDLRNTYQLRTRGRAE